MQPTSHRRELPGSGRKRPTTLRRRALVAVPLVGLLGLVGACADPESPADGAAPSETASSSAGSPQPRDSPSPPQPTDSPSPRQPTAWPRQPTASPGQPGETGLVTNVVDGDTIDVAGVGRVRVIGIDTPERGACGYESAMYALSALVLGRQVSLVPGASDDADRYDRLLRYVDRGDIDAGLSLIEDGWAIARYDSRDGYGGHPREDEYIAADAESRDRGCYPDDEPDRLR